MISIATTISSPIFSGTGCERAESAVGIRYTGTLIHTICAPHLFLTPPPLQSGDRLVALQHTATPCHTLQENAPHSNALSSRFINNIYPYTYSYALRTQPVSVPDLVTPSYFKSFSTRWGVFFEVQNVIVIHQQHMLTHVTYTTSVCVKTCHPIVFQKLLSGVFCEFFFWKSKCGVFFLKSNTWFCWKSKFKIKRVSKLEILINTDLESHIWAPF